MPKIVDHQARRRAVAEIAAKLIARDGLEGTKVREIARLAGYSTSIVSHYFKSKHELLMSAYRMRMERTVAHVETVSREGNELLYCLGAVLPLDEERVESWRIWLAFWGLATADETFLLEQRQRSRESVELFHRTIVNAGAMQEGEHSWLVAQALLSSVAGIATQAIYDPESWPPERQLAILKLQIDNNISGSMPRSA
ncbi:TetR/AcrR family transcriptional regulator [Novosphingobium sp. KN65.2]|uniref:TetR/AcrR family transcriptional regulator n=1 Tax=Novosphingobium sp. KN65.2 TaxID=1478134 RepID=UPI0005E8D813|nr:TetR/AcrR family transcriptional regulator [Novosphingobium sp. KN65.2]CDO36523.1 putative Transcriptional regulator, TetR family [Novosphingobium sp. KN65.2]